jgi:hypothetical protein
MSNSVARGEVGGGVEMSVGNWIRIDISIR